MILSDIGHLYKYFVLPIREFPAPTKQQSLNCWIELTYLSPQESEERGQNADDEDDAVRRIRQVDRQLRDLKEMCVKEGIHFRFAQCVAP